jgi:hypothetical protein
MNYQKIYNQIIERAKNRVLGGYKEKHHILPKCLGGDNKKENLIELTAREHFLSHMLLCEIHPKNDKLKYALWLMVIGKKRWKQNDPYKISSRTYEFLKLNFIKVSKKKIISKDQKLKISKANSKKVIQYNFNGDIIKSFKSAADAERYIINNLDEHWRKLNSNINTCCRLGQKSAYGYIWKYEGDPLNLENHIGSNNCKITKTIVYQNKTYDSQIDFFEKTGMSSYIFYKMLKEKKIIYEN